MKSFWKNHEFVLMRDGQDGDCLDMERIIKLIESDSMRMKALKAVRTLGLPDWLIAAGFVRNLIWNRLYGTAVGLNDVDVIYFCRQDSSEERDRRLEEEIHAVCPDLPWSITNQARMHVSNGDRPHQSSLDAMSYWPEKQTCIGITLDHSGQMHVHHCFDLSLQFNGTITQNPKRSLETFNRRVRSKGWLETWPLLRVEAS